MPNSLYNRLSPRCFFLTRPNSSRLTNPSLSVSSDEFDTLVMRNQLRFFGLRGACEAVVGRLPMMTIILASCFIFCKASNSSRISGKFSLISPVSCQPESAFVRKIARRWAASGRDPT